MAFLGEGLENFDRPRLDDESFLRHFVFAKHEAAIGDVFFHPWNKF